MGETKVGSKMRKFLRVKRASIVTSNTLGYSILTYPFAHYGNN